MNPDSPENGAEDAGEANGTEQQPTLHSMSTPQSDRLDETIAADGAAAAESEPFENQPAATDANVEVDFGGPESTAHGLSVVDHKLVPPIDSDFADPLELPELSDLTLSADMPRSEPEDVSPTDMDDRHFSESSDLEPSMPAQISLDGLEQPADSTPIDQLAFSIDAAMSLDSTTESSARSRSNEVAASAVPFSSPESSNASFAYTQNHFSESTGTTASPDVHPASDFARLAQSKSNVEPHPSSVDDSERAKSELLRHNWDKGIPGLDDQSPDESAGFRMPPLLLEVSRTDYQSRIEKIEAAAAAQLNKIIDERIEDALNERDFMRAAEMRALFR